MIKNRDMQIGKAGEYIVCADAIMKGLIAYPSEQGLPYDVVIDNGERLLKCQVKTTEKPRLIPQRNKETEAYIFNIKRHGKNNSKKYSENDVDIFALVELENRCVAYIENRNMPSTINLRVDAIRGHYYDEKGLGDYQAVEICISNGMTQTETAKQLDLNISTVNRMFKKDYKPFISKARYFSDFKREREWFNDL